jgi:hypothetical protein
MRPRRPEGEPSDDLFRARLSNQLDDKHPLIRSAGLIEWESFEAEFGALYHETLGRPGKPTRLMVGLTYLKHCYNLSDEQVCERWPENPLYQAEQVLLAAAPLIMAKTGTLSLAESPLNLIPSALSDHRYCPGSSGE